MKTSKYYSNLLLPIIVFNIAYLMLYIQSCIQTFPPPTGPSFGDIDFTPTMYMLWFILSIPYILISYLYLFFCQNDIFRFKIITPLFVVGYVFLFVISDPLGLMFISLLAGLFYWIPFILIYMILFIRYDNKKWMQLVALGLSLALLVFTYVAFISSNPTSDTRYWSIVYQAFWIVIYFISYLLCQFKKFNMLWGICAILMLSASSILEFYTPLDYILTTMFLIAFIMFGAEMVARYYIKKEDKE